MKIIFLLKIRTKAQMVGQVFIYILAIILVAFILIYGYKAIEGFKKTGEDVMYIGFRNKFNADVKTASQYDTIKRYDYELPTKFKEVCFIDIGGPASYCPSDSYPLMCDSWESEVKKNVFLMPNSPETPPEQFFSGDANEDESYFKLNSPFYLCLPTDGGKIKIQLEGKGKYVLLSKWI
ncbi:hypothetical protein J4209_05735 [Candidatus Woesearchaeota archaeon]|nr:hypothetical protein [Candidatus Woesearchaeota archaeon]